MLSFSIKINSAIFRPVYTLKGGQYYAKIYSVYDAEGYTGIVEFCQEGGEPVFVTRNGTPEMVIMDAVFFDEYLRYRDEKGKLNIWKEFARIPDVITIKKLKKTGEVAARCSQTDEPVSIIRNGYAALVVISLEGYRRRQAEIWGKSTLIMSKKT